MTQAAKRTPTRTPRTSDSQPTLNGRDPQDLVDDRDRDRDDDNERDGRTERDEQDSRDEQSEQRARREQDERRTVEQLTDRARAATSHSVDAFAGTPDMSKVVTAWFDMAGNMMKLQQQFFTAMLEAGNTNDRPTTKV